MTDGLVLRPAPHEALAALATLDAIARNEHGEADAPDATHKVGQAGAVLDAFLACVQQKESNQLCLPDEWTDVG
jgi:hypothetical protein